MLVILISMFPILNATLCLLLKKSTSRSMITGTIVGLAIFLLKDGFSFENIILIGNTTVTTITDNVTVLISILLLFILVYLIQNSRIILALNDLTEDYMYSPKRIVIFLIIFGIIFSLDDYLACIAMGTIFTESTIKQGFSKEKIAFMINITAVSCCCISPFSSWMPVLKSALSVSGVNETVIYQTLPYNYSALFGIFIVIFIGLFRPRAFNSIPNSSRQAKSIMEKEKKNYFEMIVFFVIISILIVSLILMIFIFPCSNAVIKSSMISIVIALPLFIWAKAINYSQIKHSIRKALKSTWDLSKLLLSIWLLTNVCNNILGLADNISAYTNNANFPIIILPAAIFALSGIFAFSTGSAYGTFGLFIPLATQFTNNVNSTIQTMTIAAAIAGSLMAASSFASDTLELTAKNTQSNKEYLQFAQLPYSILLYTISFLSFFVSGICVQYGKIFTIIVPIIISICISIEHLILMPLLYVHIQRTISNILTFWLSIRTCNYKITTHPYPPLKYTFHSIYIMMEKYIQLKIKIFLHKILSFTTLSYLLKIPGLL